MDVQELVAQATAAVDQLQQKAEDAVMAGLNALVELGEKAQAKLDEMEGESAETAPESPPVATQLPAEPTE